MTETLLLFAAGAGASQAVLLGFMLLRHPVGSIQSRLLLALIIGALAYFLSVSFKSSALLYLQSLIPGLLWLFSASVFDDAHRLKRWQVLLVACLAALPFLDSYSSENAGLYHLLLTQFPQLMEFVFLLLALTIIGRSWRADLVQTRRRARAGFCGFLAIYVSVLIFTREILAPSTAWFPAIQYSVSACVLLLVNVSLLQLGSHIWRDLLERPKRKMAALSKLPINTDTDTDRDGGKQTSILDGVAIATDSQNEADLLLLNDLAKLMQEQRVYREMGLSIGQLAARLDTPEYRLRQVINARTGYRNFRDFLNSYRVEEAAHRIISAHEQTLPILSIAMEVGFRSLSSFNKVFKETYDLTPTAYRKQHIGNL